MSEDDFKVVIAGGGVAAAEAALALHELARSRIDLELIAPNDQLVLPALAVAEPFGMDPPPALPLADLCRDSGAVQRRDDLSMESMPPPDRSRRDRERRSPSMRCCWRSGRPPSRR